MGNFGKILLNYTEKCDSVIFENKLEIGVKLIRTS